MTIVTLPLTVQLANGTPNDASQVMTDLNQIANDVNANAAPLASVVTLTALAAATGSSLVGFSQDFVGAVTRTAEEKLEDFVDIQDAGATTGSADNSASINSALTTGGNGNYARMTTGTYMFATVLNITTPTHFSGEGFYSSLQPTAAFGAGNNNFHIAPSAALTNYMSVLEKFTIGNPLNGTRVGAAGIFLDTAVIGSNSAKFTLRDMTILQGSSAALTAINNPANNVNGGLYAANIENNILQGGINLQSTGDSNCIHKNILTGTGTGIYASNVTGASLLSMVDNNITTTGGAVQIDAGSRFKFLRNNCEQTVTFTGGATYMMNVSGANGTMSLPEIRGNHFGLFSSIVNSGCLYISNTQGALVSENTFVNANASAVGIVIAANAVNTRIGPNNYGSAITTKVTDGGIGTMGIIKFPTLLNSWMNNSANTAQFYKDILGHVRLNGTITAGTLGVAAFVLPAGFLPTQLIRASVYSNNGGAQVLGSVFIDTGGNVVPESGSNVQISLDGICFPAVGLADTISNL